MVILLPTLRLLESILIWRPSRRGNKFITTESCLQVTRDINPVSKFEGTELDQRNYQNGEVIRINGEFFQFLEDVPAEGADFDALKNTSLLALGEKLPQEVDELSYFATALGGEQRFFASKSYNTGDLAKLYDAELNDYRYFEFSQTFLREDELKIGFNVDPEKTGNGYLPTQMELCLLSKLTTPHLAWQNRLLWKMVHLFRLMDRMLKMVQRLMWSQTVLNPLRILRPTNHR